MKYLSIHNRASAEDPLKAHNWLIDLADFERLGFATCSGLNVDLAIAEYHEGGSNTASKSPGKATYADITFTRGQIIAVAYGKNDMLNWLQQTHDASAKIWQTAPQFRRSPVITQNANDGGPGRRWKVREAFPKNHKAFSDLDASKLAENVIETLVIAHEGYSVTL